MYSQTLPTSPYIYCKHRTHTLLRLGLGREESELIWLCGALTSLAGWSLCLGRCKLEQETVDEETEGLGWTVAPCGQGFSWETPSPSGLLCSSTLSPCRAISWEVMCSIRTNLSLCLRVCWSELPSLAIISSDVRSSSSCKYCLRIWNCNK